MLGRLHFGSLLPFLVQLNRNFLFLGFQQEIQKKQDQQLRITHNFADFAIRETYLWGPHEETCIF